MFKYVCTQQTLSFNTEYSILYCIWIKKKLLNFLAQYQYLNFPEIFLEMIRKFFFCAIEHQAFFRYAEMSAVLFALRTGFLQFELYTIRPNLFHIYRYSINRPAF
jgi:hypothetical protein